MVLEDIELNLLMYVSYDFAKKFNVLPIRRYENGIIIMCSEINNKVIGDLKEIFNENIVPYVHSKETVKENINHYYEIFNKKIESSENYSEDLYDEIFSTAIDLKSRDIHIEPYNEFANVRFRCDGQLKNFKKISLVSYKFILNKIKVLCDFNTKEKNLLQDSTIFYKHNGIKFNISVSILNTLKGEKLYLRIKYNEIINNKIDDLGFNDEQIKLLKSNLKKKTGMILLSGPISSGKSTTIYKFLEYLNNENTSIYTIENSVEYEIEGITQICVNEKEGVTFDKIYKNILKHDPDVLMIEEIKDKQIANAAVSSSVIGHKVFSTIHAKDSVSAIMRLINLGDNELLTVNGLDLIVFQRLVKKLCKCKKKEFVDDKFIFNNKYNRGRYYFPKGCEKCRFTGYSGRILLGEILVIDDIIKDMILKKKSSTEIKNYVNEKYYKYSFENSLNKLILNGDVCINDFE